MTDRPQFLNILRGERSSPINAKFIKKFKSQLGGVKDSTPFYLLTTDLSERNLKYLRETDDINPQTKEAINDPNFNSWISYWRSLKGIEKNAVSIRIHAVYDEMREASNIVGRVHMTLGDVQNLSAEQLLEVANNRSKTISGSTLAFLVDVGLIRP